MFLDTLLRRRSLRSERRNPSPAGLCHAVHWRPWRAPSRCTCRARGRALLACFEHRPPVQFEAGGDFRQGLHMPGSGDPAWAGSPVRITRLRVRRKARLGTPWPSLCGAPFSLGGGRGDRQFRGKGVVGPVERQAHHGDLVDAPRVELYRARDAGRLRVLLA